MISCDREGLLCKVIQNNNITGTRCLGFGENKCHVNKAVIGPGDLTEKIFDLFLTQTYHIMLILIFRRYLGYYDLPKCDTFLISFLKGDCY